MIRILLPRSASGSVGAPPTTGVLALNANLLAISGNHLTWTA